MINGLRQRLRLRGGKRAGEAVARRAGSDPLDPRHSLVRRRPRVFRASRAALRDPRYLAYVEILLGLGALVAVNSIFFPNRPGFVGVDPHPYWAVIVLVAARYGSPAGYVAGGLSALLYLAAVALAAGSVSGVDFLDPRTVLEPVLFFLAGAVVGELREAQKRSHRGLAQRYDELEENVRDLAERYLASMELNRELERRIVNQTSTVTTLYEAARALDGLDIRELTPAVLELAGSFIEAESCSLYLRREGGFVLEAARPSGGSAGRPEELDTTRGLPALVLGERRTATARELISEATPSRILRQEMLMATPLLSEDRDVMGILVVEKMPFLRFTPAAVKLFALLGDWASSALQRALRFQQTRDRNIEDEVTGAYNHSYVLKRLGEEIERSRLYGVPLTLVAVRVEGYEEIPPVKVPGVLRTLSFVFRHGTRTIDVLGKHADEGTFLFVLPHVSNEEGAALADRLRREVSAFGFKPFDDERSLAVVPGVASFSEDTPNAEALVEDALRAVEGTVAADSRGRDGR